MVDLQNFHTPLRPTRNSAFLVKLPTSGSMALDERNILGVRLPKGAFPQRATRVLIRSRLVLSPRGPEPDATRSEHRLTTHRRWRMASHPEARISPSGHLARPPTHRML